MVKIIQIKVMPKAKKNAVKKFGSGFKVYLTAPPVKGKANKSLLKVLASYLNLKKSQLAIVKGKRSKEKLIRIDDIGEEPQDDKSHIVSF